MENKTELIRISDLYCTDFKEDLSYPPIPFYNNYLVGIFDTPTDWAFNFAFVQGKSSNKCYEKLTFKQIKGEIRKIILFYNKTTAQLTGIQLFDFDGEKLYQSAEQEGMVDMSEHQILLD